jgi:tetratricopeptide (TPR) repeat protein
LSSASRLTTIALMAKWMKTVNVPCFAAKPSHCLTLNRLRDWIERRIAVERGLEASQRLEDKREEANCIRALGDVHHMLAEYAQARERYEQARPIYAEIGDRYSYAANLAYLGLAHKGLNKVDKARSHLTEAIAIFKEIDVPNVIETVRQWLNDLDAG